MCEDLYEALLGRKLHELIGRDVPLTTWLLLAASISACERKKNEHFSNIDFTGATGATGLLGLLGYWAWTIEE